MPLELVDRSGQSLFELISRLALKHDINSSWQAISQHLGVVEAGGLIRTRRERRSKLNWFVAVPLQAAWERGPNSTDKSISNPTEEGIQK